MSDSDKQSPSMLQGAWNYVANAFMHPITELHKEVDWVHDAAHEAEKIPQKISNGIQTVKNFKDKVEASAGTVSAEFHKAIDTAKKVGHTVEALANDVAHSESLFGSFGHMIEAFFATLMADVFGSGHFQDFAKDMSHEMDVLAAKDKPQASQTSAPTMA